ncbi:MAG: hypothetical protein M1828_002090 [Chrysothrix sp. TS-e1954]|nr:MAG: hypothetical protein M1828_002090 [Chrysothrix sp. TS-e1954]
MSPSAPIRAPTRLVVTINSAGRQSASFIRVASAVGWHVRAQVHSREGLVAEELAELKNVTLVEGNLEDSEFVAHLFDHADCAFINTTHWGDEVAIGHALADVAKAAGLKHYVYSSMPDHKTFDKGWRGLPLWSSKYAVEKYIRSLGIPATFVYTGIYNNNFTSLPYPLFRMELQMDGTFIWKAPFPPNERLPWLDAEHDVGPALIQIFKQGPEYWSGHRIPLTFEVLTPRQACWAFAKGVGRKVTYQQSPIEITCPIPTGYREHLEALEETLGTKAAPYFGPTMYYPHEAIQLWEGNRGLEEYAREIFPEEERANGMTWMDDSDSDGGGLDAKSAEETRQEAENSFTGSC